MEKEEFKEIAEIYAKKFIAKIFPENIKKIENAICVVCGNKIEGFKNAIEKEEYKISGLCMDCQNKVFKANKRTNKCLNCEKEISNDAEVCSKQCAEDYFEYVTDGEKLEDYPEFKTKIEDDKKEKESDKIDWSTYTSNLPFVLWSFWFYFWGIFTEIFYFKSSLMHYNRGTGVAIIPPQRALFNLLIPSCLWNYLKNKKEKGNEDKNRSGEEN